MSEINSMPVADQVCEMCGRPHLTLIDEKLTRILDYLREEEYRQGCWAAKRTGSREEIIHKYHLTRAHAMRDAINAIRAEFPDLPNEKGCSA